jgi:predicted ArsR family transcriptional regulator
LFRKGYEPVLLELLELLSRRESPENFDVLALETGRQLVEKYLPKLHRQKPAARLNSIVSKASDAGVPLSLVRENGDVLIRGCSCPLTSVIQRRPKLCDVIARLLSEALELPVKQQCDHGAAPRCQFRYQQPKTSRAK